MSHSVRAALRLTTIVSVLAFAGVPAFRAAIEGSQQGSQESPRRDAIGERLCSRLCFSRHAQVALHRAGGESHRRRGRRAGRSEHVLCRRGERRNLEDDRRRRALEAIFDSQPVSSIGAIAVAPSDPNVVWVGTGEPFIRSHISMGWGMFRSTDAGKTWSHAGLENTGRIARIAIDPTNPDRRARRGAWARVRSAAGARHLPHDRRRQDVGASVLFVNDSTGARRRAARSDQSAHPVRGIVADRDPHVGTRERRRGERHLEVDRRRHHMEAPRGPRSPDAPVRQGRTRHQRRRCRSASTPRSRRATACHAQGEPTDTGRLFRSDDAGDDVAAR